MKDVSATRQGRPPWHGNRRYGALLRVTKRPDFANIAHRGVTRASMPLRPEVWETWWESPTLNVSEPKRPEIVERPSRPHGLPARLCARPTRLRSTALELDVGLSPSPLV